MLKQEVERDDDSKRSHRALTGAGASLLDRADDRPQGRARIRPVQRRRVEARHRAIEEQRVVAAERVPKQPRKLPEGDEPVRDREDDGVRVAHADSVSHLARDAFLRDLGMDPAVDDEHRTRLGRDLGLWLLAQVASGLDDAGAILRREEDAVRLHVEVALPVRGAGALQLLPVLDIEPDRRPVLVVHAAVHGEGEILLDLAQPVERAVGLALRTAPEQLQPVFAQVHGADGVIRVLVKEGPARPGRLRKRRASGEGGSRERADRGKQAQRPHAYSSITAVTGTWSDGLAQLRVSRATSTLLRVPARSGETQT